MPPETIYKIYAIDQGNQNHHGTGLGLYLIREIIQKQGGISGTKPKKTLKFCFYFAP